MDHENDVGLLEKRQKEILGDVRQALKELKQARDRDRLWKDPDNDPSNYKKKDSGVIIALEALLCFLLPLNSTKKDLAFQSDVYAVFDSVKLAGEIRNTLEKIRLADYAFSGEPYITVEDNKGTSHPFVDTACLTLSVILFANRVLGLPNTRDDEILYRDVFEKAMNVLTGALIKDDKKPGKGWFVTNYSPPDWQYKYCTWMATDTFSDISSVTDLERQPYCPGSTFTVRSVEITLDSLCDELHRFYVLSDLTDDERARLKDKGAKICVRNSIVQEDPDDPERFQFNVWILLTLLYLKYGARNESDDEAKERLLLEAFRFAADWVRGKEDKLISDEVTIQFETKDFEVERLVPLKNNLHDRAALPQWIKALAIALKRHKEWRPVFGEHLSAMIELARKNKGEGRHVWDADAKGEFAIYLTERYIEAFTKYYEYLDALIAEKKPSIEAPIQTTTGVNWQVIAAEIAKSAVVIQVGSEKAEGLVKRLVSAEIETVRSKVVDDLGPRVAEEIGKQLGAQSEQVRKLGEELAMLQDAIMQARQDMPRTGILKDMAAKTMKQKPEKA